MAKLIVALVLLLHVVFALPAPYDPKIAQDLFSRKQARSGPVWDNPYSYELVYLYEDDRRTEQASWIVPPKPLGTPGALQFIFELGGGIENVIQTMLWFEDNVWKVSANVLWFTSLSNPTRMSNKVEVKTGDKITGVIYNDPATLYMMASVYVNGVLTVSIDYVFDDPYWGHPWEYGEIPYYVVQINYVRLNTPDSVVCAMPRTNALIFNVTRPLIHQKDISNWICGNNGVYNGAIVSTFWTSSYTFEGYSNTNFDGANLQVVSNVQSAFACAQQCDLNPSCIGWTFGRDGCPSAKNCYLKSALGTPTLDTCAVSYPKLGETNKALIGGNPIAVFASTTGAQNCSFRCEANPDCRSWSFNGATSECTLVSDAPNVTASTGVTSGSRALATGNNYYLVNLRENKALNNQYLLPTGSQVYDNAHRRVFVSAPPTSPDANLQWTLVQASPTYYMLKPVFDQTKCLDANWFVTQFGGINTPWMAPCNGKASQLWRFVPVPNVDNRFVYNIVSTYGGCLSAHPEKLTSANQFTVDFPSPFLWNCINNPDARGAQWAVTLPHFGYTL